MSQENKKNEYKINWFNSSILVLTAVIAIVAVPLYGSHFGYNTFDWICFAVFMILTGLGITAGYHRLWSHKAYDANVLYRAFFAYWGACAGQNTILDWCADHRVHHRHTDHEEKDPYAATKGFFWAHMGWVMVEKEDDPNKFDNVKDLNKDPVVIFQSKHYLFLTMFSNIIVPIILGWINMKYYGAENMWSVLVLAGFGRFFLNHHFTFFINSACHFFGWRPYSDKDTSRDNFLLALVTYGEGYHNFHHTFQADYRNGIRWYHFDPTKWVIVASSKIGLTSNLKSVPEELIQKKKIERKVLKKVDKFCLQNAIDKSSEMYTTLQNKLAEFKKALDEWSKAMKSHREKGDSETLAEKWADVVSKREDVLSSLSV